MKNDFNSLEISPPILKAIKDMDFTEPTEVQSKAIPHVLAQEDVIVMSKTGSGKTAVYGIPLLEMIDAKSAGPQGLILTPTRELAVQVDNDLKRIGKYLPHRTTAVYGQHSMNFEIQALNKGVSIVTGTPGRVYDHISHGTLKTKNIRYLILDEADRMLDMGFLGQVERIIKTVPKNRVTLLFSATIPPEVRTLCLNYMKNPVTIEIESQTKTVETTQQAYYRVDRNEKNTHLNRLLLYEQPESCVIFCNKRSTVDRVQNFLDRKGYACQSLHGDIPQSKRLKTIQDFKQHNFHLLVATDVAARGIHIDELSLVINYDVPLEKDAYIHRIGRTGRAGNGGRALTLVTSDEIISLYEIEEHIGTLIEEAELPTEADLDEHRDAIKKWTQSNSHKRKQLAAPAGNNSGGTGPKKPPQPKSVPDHQKQRNQQNRNVHTPPVKPATNKPHTEPVKPAPPVTPVPRAPEPNRVPVTASSETKPTPPAAPKKSFLQRALERIGGRKKHG